MTTTSRTFMIVLDAATSGDHYHDVARFITSNAVFERWWNYLPYTFMVSNGLDADAITGRLLPLIRSARFLVMKVDPASSAGRLPRGSWEWIRHRVQQPELSQSVS